MKKSIVCITALLITSSTFAYDKLKSSELKAMDCATLSVEKADAKRALESSERNLANINANAPTKTLGKFASAALGAFAGKSETMATASSVAAGLGEDDGTDASNPAIQQKIKENAQANFDNIAVFQKTKKCKV
ncbi:hypothetical protein [Acinetobacter equi]|uniref:Uncharacterized protein n=1 Tax=Acinetobacter equi TaxID=1324350 RepID=A0A0N9V506_9GAMM|nr:hypothetical protein [Acinetobacter equi]ALH94313.1 hypothetical protein AOY20_01460 [Acinetobacter equi]